MKKFIVCFLFYLLHNSCLFAQLYDGTWFIGSGGGFGNSILSFDTTSFGISWINKDIRFFGTNVSISNANGQLSFFSDGMSIYDSAYNIMPNADSISPSLYTFQQINTGLGIFQGCLAIPKPGTTSQYYLFHETIDSISSFFFQPYYLYYSLIDMNLNNGLGDVVNKNTVLFQDTLILGRLTACKHGNGRDWWLISHHYNSNLYYKWLITPYGISGPFSQNIGSDYLINTGYAYSCFSPDGSQFATVYTDDYYFKTIELFKFDRCTGLLSDSVHILVPSLQDSFYNAIGCAFSPNSRYLYMSCTWYIYQFDTWAVDIPASQKLVATCDGYIASDSISMAVFAVMETAPNGKIIVGATSGSKLLSTIDQPNNGDTLCNVLQHNIVLPSYNFFTLPNFPDYRLGNLTGSPCDTLTGVETTDNAEFLIYPNPAQKTFLISGLRFEVKEIKIYDVIGNVVLVKAGKKENEAEIDVSSLAPGLYFVQLKTQRGVYTQKVIKE